MLSHTHTHSLLSYPEFEMLFSPFALLCFVCVFSLSVQALPCVNYSNATDCFDRRALANPQCTVSDTLLSVGSVVCNGTVVPPPSNVSTVFNSDNIAAHSGTVTGLNVFVKTPSDIGPTTNLVVHVLSGSGVTWKRVSRTVITVSEDTCFIDAQFEVFSCLVDISIPIEAGQAFALVVDPAAAETGLVYRTNSTGVTRYIVTGEPTTGANSTFTAFAGQGFGFSYRLDYEKPLTNVPGCYGEQTCLWNHNSSVCYSGTPKTCLDYGEDEVGCTQNGASLWFDECLMRSDTAVCDSRCNAEADLTLQECYKTTFNSDLCHVDFSTYAQPTCVNSAYENNICWAQNNATACANNSCIWEPEAFGLNGLGACFRTQVEVNLLYSCSDWNITSCASHTGCHVVNGTVCEAVPIVASSSSSSSTAGNATAVLAAKDTRNDWEKLSEGSQAGVILAASLVGCAVVLGGIYWVAKRQARYSLLKS